jgi:glycosyltransferase involved in cell wall biosynthesis
MSDTMPYRSTRYLDMTDEMLVQWKTAFSEKVAEAIQRFKPDYIICHHLWLLTALVTEQVKDIPIAAVSHGTDLRQLQQAGKFADEVILGCSKVNLIFALNEHQREKIALYYGFEMKRIIVIGGGFRPDIFYAGERTRKHQPIRLVYAGKLSYSKGVVSLIHAFDRMSREDCELYLVGSGAGEEAERIKEAGRSSSKKILFTGAVSQEQLAEIFRQSDLFILPSFYEGLSLVLIEALASGLRVVASELPGLAEWLGKDICQSGAVEFAALPPLLDVDKPIESELPAFEDRMKKAIELQQERILAHEPLDHHLIYKNLMRVSWESVFQKIENCLQIL